MIGGGDQRARTASEITCAQPREGCRLAPVGLDQADRQFREQRRGLGQGIEGRQELAVADQSLERPTVDVVRPRGAVRLELARDVRQPVEQRRRDAVGNRNEHLPGHVEDRPVVDLQDPLPLPKHWRLGQHAAPPQGVERPYLVDPREHRLERERVRENGHRHPSGLLTGFLAERLGDTGFDRREIRAAQACRGFPHPGLQRVEAPGNDALGDRGVFDQVREIVDSARQPSAPGPALMAGVFGARKQTKLVGRACGCRFQIRLGRGLEGDGHAYRDALFDDVPRISQARAESGDRIVLNGSRGHVLGLQDHRRRERVAYDEIRRAAALDRPVLFGGHAPPPRRVFRPQNAAQCLVEGAFAVGRHALRSVRVDSTARDRRS